MDLDVLECREENGAGDYGTSGSETYAQIAPRPSRQDSPPPHSSQGCFFFILAEINYTGWQKNIVWKPFFILIADLYWLLSAEFNPGLSFFLHHP